MTTALLFRSYLPVMPPAAVMTALLLLIMYSLIATDYVEPVEEGIKINTSFLDPVKEMEPPKIKPPVKPDDVQKAPDRVPQNPVFDERTATKIDFGIALKPLTNGKITVNPNSGPIPSVRVEPNYPPRAIQRGIEGYVDLMFDISAAGSTENIRIIRSKPSGIFDRSAVKAISKWKYQPQMIDGKATISYDQVTRLTFNLQD